MVPVGSIFFPDTYFLSSKDRTYGKVHASALHGLDSSRQHGSRHPGESMQKSVEHCRHWSVLASGQRPNGAFGVVSCGFNGFSVFGSFGCTVESTFQHRLAVDARLKEELDGNWKAGHDALLGRRKTWGNDCHDPDGNIQDLSGNITDLDHPTGHIHRLLRPPDRTPRQEDPGRETVWVRQVGSFVMGFY